MLLCCLLLEEYGPITEYKKWTNNDATAALNRLPLIKSGVTESDVKCEQLAESYGVDQLDGDTFPLTYRMINKYQRKDKEMVEKLKCANYHTKYFRGGGNTFMIICKNDKIVVPEIIRKYVVNWYHTYLLYTGTEHT